MGNYSLFLVLAGTLTISLLLYSSRSATQGADDRLSEHVHKTLAREAAMTGLNMTVRKLVADTSSWTVAPSNYEFIDAPYRSASFTTDVRSPWGAGWLNGVCHVDTVLVVSTGTAGGGAYASDGSLEPAGHQIEATYVRTCGEADGGPPALFGYPIIADGDMTLESNVKVMSPTDSTNSGIHANGRMIVNGNPLVQGYGTYSTTGGSCQGGCTGFQPNNDVNHADPNYFEAPEVDIEPFDPEEYRPQATFVTNGNVTFEGGASTVDFTDFNGVTGSGTEDDPYLWFVDGNITFNAETRFLGYGLIVTTGYVTIASNVNIYSSMPAEVTPPVSTSDNPNTGEVRPFLDQYLDQGTTFGLYIGGSTTREGRTTSIVTSGTSQFMGLLYSNSGVHIAGDMTIFGSVAAVGDVSLTGKTMVWYEGGNDSVALDLGAGNVPMPEGIRLLSYVEW